MLKQQTEDLLEFNKTLENEIFSLKSLYEARDYVKSTFKKQQDIKAKQSFHKELSIVQTAFDAERALLLADLDQLRELQASRPETHDFESQVDLTTENFTR
jgi:hypothetical protein